MAVTPSPIIPPPLLDDYAGQPVGFQIPPPIIQPVDVAPVPVEALPADVAAPPPVPGQLLPPPRIDAPDLYAGMPERLPPPRGFVPPTPAEGQPDAAQAAAGRVSQGLLGYADSLIPRQPTPAAPAPAGQAPASAEPGEQPQPMDPATRYQVDVARARAEQAAADEDAVLAAGLAQQRLQEQRRVRQEQYDQSRQEAQEYVDAELQRLSDRATEPLLDGRSKIALAVAAGLKALASGLSGGRVGNDAVELINRTLRQRAEERARQDHLARERVAARRQEVMDIGQQEAQYFQQVELDMAAEQANLAQQIRENAARFGTAEAQANAETLAGRLEAEAAARAAEVADKKTVELLEQTRANRELDLKFMALDQRERESRRQTGLGYANLRQRQQESEDRIELEAKKLEAEGNREQAKLVRTTGVPLPGTGGQMLLAPDPESARDMRKRVTAARQMVDIIDNISRKRAELGKEGFGSWIKTEDGKKMTAEWRNLFMESKEFFALGAIQGADEKLIEGLIGEDPATTWTTTAPILQATRGRLIQRTNSMLQDNDTSGTLEGFRWEPPQPRAPVESAESKLGRELTSREGRQSVVPTAPTAWQENIDARWTEAVSPETSPERRKQIVEAMQTAQAQESNPEIKKRLGEALKAIKSNQNPRGTTQVF